MKFIPNAVSAKVARELLVGQKHSPQMLFAAGLVGVGATVVLACRATLKVEGILEDHEKTLTSIDFAKQATDGDELVRRYSEKDARQDTAKLYVRTALRISKNYAPAIICGFAAVSALAGSHNLLTKRNAALTAGYGALQKTFSEYRDRVRESVGEEKERDIFFDLEKCEVEDEATGKLTKVKKVGARGISSPYARLFNELNRNYEPTPEYNFLFLKLKQQYWNDRLQARGHVFLNEIYDELGFERSKEGAVVGWVKDQGDNYIDFGVFQDRMEERIVDFMVGREKEIWLDFNVDGVIYDKI